MMCLMAATGSVHEKGLAVHEQNAARRAERLAERAAEEAEAEEYEAYDDAPSKATPT